MDEKAAIKIQTIEEIERHHILGVLATVPNRCAAARALGISAKTLYAKLHKYHDQGFIKEWRMPR